MIDGVRVKPLQVHRDSRGRVMEILRSDDEIFLRFGQVYMTTARPGVVKGWHFHRQKIENFAALRGTIRLVLFDARENSPTRGEQNEFLLGEDHPQLVQVPSGVIHGFECVSEVEAIVLNCPSEVYHRENPDEVLSPPPPGCAAATERGQNAELQGATKENR